MKHFVCDKRGRTIQGVNYEAYRSVEEAKGMWLEACYSGNVAVISDPEDESLDI
jgi:hypothetical protein